MKTALDALEEKVRLQKGFDRKIAWLTARGFVFKGRHVVTSWTRNEKPTKEEHDVMVELFLFHRFGGFALTAR